MSEFKESVYHKLLERTAGTLAANNMKPFIAETRAEALDIIKTLLAEGETVSCGGSATLDEIGAMELLRSGKYNFLDRAGKSPEEAEKIYRDVFSADTYLTSSNAVTENGELYNVDGNSNRVSMIAYGPSSVIMVVGYNKIVKDLSEAVARVKTQAAPPNTKRLSCASYCRETGVCMGLGGGMTDGCNSDGRICCSYLISGPQRHKNRIKVILVAESLGF